MPKLTFNQFISAHKTGFCVAFQFFDYKRAKDAARAAKRPLITQSGQNIPTPLQVIAAFLKSAVRDDYALRAVGESKATGVRIQAIFKNSNEALRVVQAFHPAATSQHFQKTTEGACSHVIPVTVEGEFQQALAKKLDLL